jgi:integrase
MVDNLSGLAAEPSASGWLGFACLVGFGAGLGVFIAPNNHATINAAPQSLSGEAGAMLNLMRVLGTSLGVASASSMLSWRMQVASGSHERRLSQFSEHQLIGAAQSGDTEAVLALIKPLWLERPKNAERLRGRIEAVLDAARAGGHRNGENPARWRGHLEHLLPRPPKLARGHHAAMNYDEIPAFMKRLRGVDTVSARALEFAILTAGRSGEVYGARWPEIDLGGRVWIIPATRMKAGREHRVPLSDRALAVLEELAEVKINEFVFPGHRRGKPLSHVAMAKVMSRLGAQHVTVHGFRSSFRDWAGNEPIFRAKSPRAL